MLGKRLYPMIALDEDYCRQCVSDVSIDEADGGTHSVIVFGVAMK